MPELLLRTSDLAVGHGAKTVLTNLDLGLEAGSFVCFMGPNGIGKSTLIRTLAGLQKPLQGRVVLSPAASRPAVVLTDRITAGYMTVRQLITFGRYPYLSWNLKMSSTDHDIIDSAIAALNLSGLADRRLYELSDGQLQLAQIARVLAQESALILLDEPTAHLDLNNRLEITLMLRKLAHQFGRAVLMATHELDLALQTADRVWLAGKGDTVLNGTPEDLVLKGSFDDIFKLKGFDLRTGKVQHQPSRRLSVAVAEAHPAALWTRSALARSGYEVVDNDADRVIALNESGDGQLHWTIVEHTGVYSSIESLLAALESTV